MRRRRTSWPRTSFRPRRRSSTTWSSRARPRTSPTARHRSSIESRSGRLASPSAVDTQIPLPGTFRTNGIAATPNGKHLFVVDGATAQLHLLDTLTHTPVPVDLGGDTLPNADGLWLDGKTLYVVQNFRNQVALVELSPDYLSGAIVGFITEPFASNPSTKVPTTIAAFGNALYAVTAGFAPPSPDFVVRLVK